MEVVMGKELIEVRVKECELCHGAGRVICNREYVKWPLFAMCDTADCPTLIGGGLADHLIMYGTGEAPPAKTIRDHNRT